ncbi:MAG: DoxX family membrane protein [Chloroflexota bacterium]
MAQPVTMTRPDVIAATVGSPWFGRAIAALRIYFGVVYLHNGLAKILPAVPNLWPNTPIGFVIQGVGDRSARSILEFEVIQQHHPIAPYRSLVENVVLPNFGLFAFGIGAAETLVGILLILGLLTPVAAVIAAGMALHLQFATLWNDKWIYEYSVEWVPLLCLAAFRAGRWHGLDARFAATRRRWPG